MSEVAEKPTKSIMTKPTKNDLITQSENIKREDESRKKIKECTEEVEKVLAKYNMTITPIIQMTDVGFEQELLKETKDKPAEDIKK